MISVDVTTLYFLHSLGSALICGALAVFLAIHRRVAGARHLMALMIAVGQWALTYALEFRSTTLATKLFWVRLEYFGGAWTSFFVLLFVLFITGNEAWMTRPRLITLTALPVVTPLLALTNDWHHLMWRQAWIKGDGLATVMFYHRGPGFWLFAGASYLMLLAASVVLVRSYRNARHLHRKQLGIILFGIAAPWLGNALYLFDLSPFYQLDLTPVAFTLSGLAFAWGLLRYQLLDILPMAREAVLDAIGDAVFVLDANDRIVDLNPAALRLAGRQAHSVVGKSMNELPSLFTAIASHRSSKPVQVEIELEGEDGPRIIDLKVSPLLDRYGKSGGWLSIFQDVTDRKQFEKALGESEEKFRSISANALDAIVMIDPGNQICFWNKAAEDIFGYRAKEVIGQQIFALLAPPDYHQAYFKAFSCFLESGEKPVAGRTVELAAVHKNGRLLSLELSVSALQLKGQWHAVGILRDISERKRAESEQEKLRIQLQQAQRMEAIGTLAGGVAHDLNNILSGIVSYPDLILMQLPADSTLRKPIATMQASGQKAAAMVQDLLALARRGVIVSEVVDLNDVVTTYLTSPEHQALMSHHPLVRVTSRLAPDIHHMMGSPVHLSKAVMNLVANAAEAMPDGGTIVVSTGNRPTDRPIRGYDKVCHGGCVVLKVADSGTGISPEDRERIFEPFYTRKVMGRSGTGLGMSVVWGTVKDHQGHIDLETRLGRGSCFTLYFPATRKPAPKQRVRRPLAQMQGRGETILVVDDENQQLEIAAEMLSSLNYAVTAVPSGEAAVGWVKSHRADLIILDMIMGPGMDGLETCRAIWAHRPGQRIVIASGYSETERVLEAQRLGASRYLPKPYSLEAMAMAARAALEGDLPHSGHSGQTDAVPPLGG